MKARLERGFTIVELLVVIIIIVILALLVSAIFTTVKQQAEDVKIKDGAVKFADAIVLLSSKQTKGVLPWGGSGSTSAATSTGCADGKGGWQTSSYPGVQCTLGDAVIAAGYLPPDFFDTLPANTLTGSAKNNYMVQQCSDGNYLLYAQGQVSSEDLAKITALTTGVCSTQAANINGKGMGGYIKLDLV